VERGLPSQAIGKWGCPSKKERADRGISGGAQAVGLPLLLTDILIAIKMIQADVLQLVVKSGLLHGLRAQGVDVDIEGAIVIGKDGSLHAAVWER
jgi:hypothetical protein